MKIVYHNNGQLCNQIWSFANIIGHSLVYKEKVILVNFRYMELFPNMQNSKYIYHVTIPQKIVVFLSSFFRKRGCFNRYKEDCKTNGIAIIDGWEYVTEYKNLNIAHNEIRLLLSPAQGVISRCISVLQEQKKSADIIIGFHIRKGDYETHHGGDYYYEDETIIYYMRQLVVVNFGKKVKFFISSNEEIDSCKYIEFEYFTSAIISPIDDLYSLSLCDYIIGPPSTFSKWASYYGKVPIKVISKKDMIILSLDEFKVVKALGNSGYHN
ncbi:MAG: alpha-1,2-fucosyltransferase [Dysgonomonas sp.]